MKNSLLQALPQSLSATGRAAASDVSASCTGEWKSPSLPTLSECSVGSGPLSSGLEPSSPVLALQRNRDRERDRNLAGLLLRVVRLSGSMHSGERRPPFFLSGAWGAQGVMGLGMVTPSQVPG